ncbi:MAG TPA: sulfatase-like hydrolase/transferase [Nocardioides sp.]|nr:sulfatase-like hydrolase/transferase [Nocardioides sp.]
MRSRNRAAGAVLAASASVLGLCAFHAAEAPPVRAEAYRAQALHHAATSGLTYRATPGAERRAGRPNVFMITVDDAAIGDFKYMPHVQHLLADSGATLDNAIAPSPICVPARASLLTGQYAHNHGARTISGPHGGFASFDDHNTLPVWLQKAGYRTLFVGKYLNGYGEDGRPTYIPPGWNQWHATVDPTTYNFMKPELNNNGRLTRYHRYSTYVLRDQVNQLLANPARTRNPWYLWANYVAPHKGDPVEPNDPRDFDTTYPAPQDKGSFSWLPLPQKPDMFHWRAGGPSDFNAFQKAELKKVFDQRIEALQAVDRAVASHVAELKRTHQWNNTLVILTSDNGYAVGEHNVVGKLWFWREISNIPVVIHGPGVPQGASVRTLISNPDIAATIAAAAGATPTGRVVDGSNVLPLLSEPTVQRVVPLEGWKVENGDAQLYTGLRYGTRWTYFRYTNGRLEGLFDHRADPYELHNLVHSRRPAIQQLLRKLRRLDRRYAACKGSTCPNH